MSASYYYTFLTGGIGLLCVVGLAIAWLLWRDSEIKREASQSALDGVGDEFRINLERLARELSDVFSGKITSAASILPIRHPQLDGVNSNLIKTNRKALALIISSYDEMIVRKNEVREALSNGVELRPRLVEAVDATIKGISTLYLWDNHGGATPLEARSTRSWHVRDWMKTHAFAADLFPDMHLRDAVVEYLRTEGMELTPKPLAYTASEYYAKQYDRKTDPNAPFGRRREPRSDEAEDNLTATKLLSPVLALFNRNSDKAEYSSENETSSSTEPVEPTPAVPAEDESKPMA